MAKKQDEIEMQKPLGVLGLCVRGTILRRTRRLVGQNDDILIEYTIGPVMMTVQAFNPKTILPMNQFVELPVVAQIWNSRVTFRVADDAEEF